MSQTPVNTTPDYWEQACKQLAKRDRVLKRLIPEHGKVVQLSSRGDAFSTLVRSIVGQQISTKAAKSIWDKLVQLLPQVDAEHMLLADAQALRGAGLSLRKVDYLQDLARHFVDNAWHLAEWDTLSDEAIIEQLVAIRGIGRWTAEMFLIFYLHRPNVLPLDDAGLVKAISHNYFSGEPVTRSDMREVAQAWQPFCSVGTWYMWRSLNPTPVSY